MIRTWRLAFIAATVIAPAAAHGQERAAAAQPDLAKAQQIVTQICAACHGADGNSAAPANPNLAGQGADYITLQLAHFKAGVRVNATMQAMSATLVKVDWRITARGPSATCDDTSTPRLIGPGCMTIASPFA